MKKKIIILTLVLIVGIIGSILSLKKGDWNEDLNVQGILNLKKWDDDEAVTKNDFSYNYVITSTKDFYVSGTVGVMNGNTRCTILHDGAVIYEKAMETGDFPIETDIIKSQTGELVIHMSASDDVEGSYNISVNTRESGINTLIRKVKEYMK